MIRLTHQFDPAHAQASAASPKSSGGCSCCCSCCCVATTLGVSVITARAIQDPTRLKAPEEVEGRTLTSETGISTPAPLPAPRSRLWRWKLFGLLLLPSLLALGFFIDTMAQSDLAFTFSGLAVWLLCLTYLAITKRLKWFVALALVVSIIGLSFLEAFLWIRFIFH